MLLIELHCGGERFGGVQRDFVASVRAQPVFNRRQQRRSGPRAALFGKDCHSAKVSAICVNCGGNCAYDIALRDRHQHVHFLDAKQNLRRSRNGIGKSCGSIGAAILGEGLGEARGDALCVRRSGGADCNGCWQAKELYCVSQRLVCAKARPRSLLPSSKL